MYAIGINMDFTMSIPLQILRPLAADFDGELQLSISSNRCDFQVLIAGKGTKVLELQHNLKE